MSVLYVLVDWVLAAHVRVWIHCWQVGDNVYQCTGGHS